MLIIIQIVAGHVREAEMLVEAHGFIQGTQRDPESRS